MPHLKDLRRTHTAAMVTSAFDHLANRIGQGIADADHRRAQCDAINDYTASALAIMGKAPIEVDRPWL